MADWEPVETAPTDGTLIILAIRKQALSQPPDAHWVHVGWYEAHDSYPWRFIDDPDLTPTGCCNLESDDRIPANGVKEDAVTHWQPLPEPPTEGRDPFDGMGEKS